MKRILSCTLIMPLAVALTLCLTVTAGTKAEAASPAEVEAVRQKMLQEDRKRAEAERQHKEAEAKADARSAEVLRKAKAAGSNFIAFSEKKMSRSEAEAFCQRHGGKLPRINNSDAWNGRNPPMRGVLIDGFGYESRPCKKVGLPGGYYPTGTKNSARDDSDKSWYVNSFYGGPAVVGLDDLNRSYDRRVACVPHAQGSGSSASPTVTAPQTPDSGPKSGQMAEKADKAKQVRGADLARKAKEAGFIAISGTTWPASAMTWADAKAWCQQQGGKLPRINNSDSFAWANRSQITHIDGFGVPGRPWAEVGIPGGEYWAGTEQSDNPGVSWIVHAEGDIVNVLNNRQNNLSFVVCVSPAQAASPAPSPPVTANVQPKPGH